MPSTNPTRSVSGPYISTLNLIDAQILRVRYIHRHFILRQPSTNAFDFLFFIGVQSIQNQHIILPPLFVVHHCRIHHLCLRTYIFFFNLIDVSFFFKFCLSIKYPLLWHVTAFSAPHHHHGIPSPKSLFTTLVSASYLFYFSLYYCCWFFVGDEGVAEGI